MMTPDPATSSTPTVSRGRLLLLTGGAFAFAALIVLGAILPAEANVDPLGLGKLSGLSRIWAPEDRNISVRSAAGPLAREFATPFRTDEVLIPLGGFLDGAKGPRSSELEYKVRMKKGGALLYAWSVEGAQRPDDFHYDFHGHTLVDAGKATGMTVATYKQAYGLKQQGALTAPFDGIDGWQFSNSSEKPVVVRVKLAGFYELIPSGQLGNEAGIVANAPLEKARPRFSPDKAEAL